MQPDIDQSLTVLRQGGTILYPTDTVWGIGCDATNSQAIERIYAIKKRNGQTSMLILADGIDMLASYVDCIPDIALQLQYLSEKPLSVIYPQSKNLPPNLTAKDGSIGIRVVKDSFCQKLINVFGKPIVSTSANISGKPAPGTFSEISDEIKSSVDYVVFWKRNEQSIAAASSIVKINPDGTFYVVRE